MQLISFLLGALALCNVAAGAQHKYAVGSLASRANAMMSVGQPGRGRERRSIWTSAMLPKMVVSGGQPTDLSKRQLSTRSGITIGGSGGGNSQAGSGGGAATNKTADSIAALEGAKGAKNSTRNAGGGGGLSVGGLTLGGPGGGITVNNGGNGNKEPAAAQPSGAATAAPAEGQSAAAPAAGLATPNAGEAAKTPEEIAAVRESEQFAGKDGITTDRGGNAVNVGGDLGITKGSDGSKSIGGESGINIIARALGLAPASPAPLAAPSRIASPKAVPAAPAPLAAPKALPSGLDSAAPVLAPAASANPTAGIPDFVPGTTPTA